MLTNIIFKELKHNLISLRFLLTLTLTIIIIVVSSYIFIGEQRQKEADYNELVNINNKNLNDNSNNLSALSQMTQRIHIKPTKMEIVAEGGLKSLPKLFEITTFNISEPVNIQRENKYLGDFADVDWAFIVAFILSFFAILLTYNSINGEKRDGTLRLLMSNSINRNSVIIGKYLSGISSIGFPLIIGIIISMVIISLYGQISFTGEYLIKIFIFIAASLFYLSIFILIGILISSITKNPITSIIISLFIWISSAVLIPNSGSIIAAKLSPIPSYNEYDRQVRHTRSEISDAHRARYARTFRWNGDIWAEWVPYRCAAVQEIDETRNSMWNNYMYQRLNQVKKTRTALSISPTAVFNSLSEQICTTGLDRFQHFYEQIWNYRNTFKEFITEKDRLDTESPHLIYSWEETPMSQKPVDSNSIPRFQENQQPLRSTLKNALFNFAILIVFNMILFILVYFTFSKYDVR
ncbi:ABC transporter permease subunit [candidate division KSB1 bacterium]